MKTHTSLLAAACGLALAVSGAPARGAESQSLQQQSQQPQAQPSARANFAGTWIIRLEGVQRRNAPPANNNGNGGAKVPSGNNDNNAPPANPTSELQVRQSLVITADGSNFQVDHRTRQGDTMAQATASGNTLSWTEQHTNPKGRSVDMRFTATVTGDTMQGTVAGPRGRVQREFSGTRDQGQ